jgi:hypothetical protein
VGRGLTWCLWLSCVFVITAARRTSRLFGKHKRELPADQIQRKQQPPFSFSRSFQYSAFQSHLKNSSSHQTPKTSRTPHILSFPTPSKKNPASHQTPKNRVHHSHIQIKPASQCHVFLKS